MMAIKRWILVIGAATAFCPTATLAQDWLFKKTDCPTADARVSNDIVRDRLFEKAGLRLSTKTALLLANGQLGAETAARFRDCSQREDEERPACSDQDKAFEVLFGLANSAINPPLADDSLLARASLNPSAPASLELRVVGFLNGTADWLSFKCSKAIEPGPSSPPAPPLKQDLEIIIAKAEGDAAKAFDKRDFASVSFDHDGLTDETGLTADVFVGFGARNTASPLIGFISYQRRTPSSKGNDLAIGASYTTYFEGLGGPGAFNSFNALVAWETDDRFRSSLWRAQFGWSPQPIFCERANIPAQFYMSCDATLVIDHSNVVDPGRKEKLISRESFTRGGADLRFEVWKGRGDKLGFYTFATTYSVRSDFTDADADADLFTASIGIKTGDKSRFKVSLDYSVGEDLTSLEEIETVKLSFGYRQ